MRKGIVTSILLFSIFTWIMSIDMAQASKTKPQKNATSSYLGDHAAGVMELMRQKHRRISISDVIRKLGLKKEKAPKKR